MKSLSIGSFYYSTWAFLIINTLIISAATDGIMDPAIAIAFLISFISIREYPSHTILVDKIILYISATILPVVIVISVTQDISVESITLHLVKASIAALPLLLRFGTTYLRYWLTILTITLIHVGCILLTSSIITYFALMSFLVISIFSLNSAMLYYQIQKERRHLELPSSYFYLFIKIIPVGILISAVVFVAFPRVKNFLPTLGVGKKSNQTGYSGNLEFSHGNNIDESYSVALVVKSRSSQWFEDNKNDLYFKGKVLTAFDGKRWTIPLSVESEDRRGIILPLNNKYETLTLFKNPDQTDDIFYIDDLKGMHSNLNLSQKIIVKDKLNNYSARDTEWSKFEYQISVSPKKSNENRMTVKSISENSKNIDPELTNLNSIKNEDYFKKWLKSTPPISMESDIQSVLDTIAAFFQKNYKASLKNEFKKQNPLDSFLNTEKEGHCEYFATAAALLLRSNHIPARIAIGFRGGEINPVSDTLEVMDRNAHAWVEVVTGKNSFIRFDPTPISSDLYFSQGESPFRSYLNAFSFWFDFYVIGYNALIQRNLVKKIWDKPSNYKQDFFKKLKPYFKHTAIGVLVLLTLLILFRVKSKKYNKTSNLPSYYQEFLKTCSDNDQHLKSGETLKEFHVRVSQTTDLDKRMVSQIDEMIERDLYSANDTKGDEKVRIKELILRS